MQGLAPIEQEENQVISDKVQFADQQNIKCSIEIKNGIPQRSLNNFHKNQNALVLNNYTVSAVFPLTRAVAARYRHACPLVRVFPRGGRSGLS